MNPKNLVEGEHHPIYRETVQTSEIEILNQFEFSPQWICGGFKQLDKNHETDRDFVIRILPRSARESFSIIDMKENSYSIGKGQSKSSTPKLKRKYCWSP